MLSVEKFPKGRALSTEKSFEDTVSKQWRWSRHMSDQNAGVPDRYLGGGRWVEFKSLKATVRRDWAWDGMSDAQQRVADELTKGGDTVRYCGLFQKTDGSRFVIVCRWPSVNTAQIFDWPRQKVDVAAACL